MPISGIEPGGPAAKDAVTTANRSIERASQRLARGVRPSLATALVLILAAIAFSVWAINYQGGGTLFVARIRPHPVIAVRHSVKGSQMRVLAQHFQKALDSIRVAWVDQKPIARIRKS